MHDLRSTSEDAKVSETHDKLSLVQSWLYIQYRMSQSTPSFAGRFWSPRQYMHSLVCYCFLNGSTTLRLLLNASNLLVNCVILTRSPGMWELGTAFTVCTVCHSIWVAFLIWKYLPGQWTISPAHVRLIKWIFRLFSFRTQQNIYVTWCIKAILQRIGLQVTTANYLNFKS